MKFKRLKEAFDPDKVQKRIACTTEFDNGHVIHNDYFSASASEAEEMARKKSLESPDKVFYVKYDDIMNPSSDIKWKNGKKLSEMYWFNDPEKMEKVEQLCSQLESEGWRRQDDKDTGKNFYCLFSKRGPEKAIWKAVRYGKQADPEIIDITYNQAIGNDPLDSNDALRKQLGKMLLPESVDKDKQRLKDLVTKIEFYVINEKYNALLDTIGEVEDIIHSIQNSMDESMLREDSDKDIVWPIGSNTLTFSEANRHITALRDDIKLLMNCDTLEDVKAHSEEFQMYNCANIIERKVSRGMSETDAIDSTATYLIDCLGQWKSDMIKFRDEAAVAMQAFNTVKNSLSQYELISADKERCVLKYRPVEGATHKDCIDFVDAVVAVVNGKYNFTGRGGSWTRWDIKTDDGVMLKAGWDGDIWSVSFPRLKFESLETTKRYAVDAIDKEDGYKEREFIFANSDDEMRAEFAKRRNPNQWSIGGWEVQNVPKSYNESFDGFKKGDRVLLSNGQTGIVTKDPDPEDDRLRVEIEGMNEIKHPLIDDTRRIPYDESFETALGGDDFDDEISAMRAEQRDIEKNNRYIIVGITKDGKRLYYNSADNTFGPDVESATKYSEKDVALDDWLCISRNEFERTFVPIYKPEMFESLNEKVGADTLHLARNAFETLAKDDKNTWAKTASEIAGMIPDDFMDDLFDAIKDKFSNIKLDAAQKKELVNASGEQLNDEDVKDCDTLGKILALLDGFEWAKNNPKLVKTYIQVVLGIVAVIEPTPVVEIIMAIIQMLPAEWVAKILAVTNLFSPVGGIGTAANKVYKHFKNKEQEATA